jgi:transposase
MTKTCTIAPIATLGIDIGFDAGGSVSLKSKFTAGKLEALLVQMPPCLIGMEACDGAHHLARRLIALGHHARLMPVKYVRPYAKGQQNDFNDAEAIAEAVTLPTMKFVQVKTAE